MGLTIGQLKKELENKDKFPHDQEPCFLLRGRDPFTPPTIFDWTHRASNAGISGEKITEAGEVAIECSKWPIKKFPD